VNETLDVTRLVFAAGVHVPPEPDPLLELPWPPELLLELPLVVDPELDPPCEPELELPL
jgi:hypothetical protein